METSSSTTALSMLGNRALLWMKDLLFDILDGLHELTEQLFAAVWLE